MKRAALPLILLLVVPLLLALKYEGMAGSVLSVLHIRTTDTCISGYTRDPSQPNHCHKDSWVSTTWTDAVACTSTAPVDTLPTTATSADLILTWKSLSNNGVGQRGNEVWFWNNATCASSRFGYSRFDTREFVAVAAGTGYSTETDHFSVPLVDEAGVMKFRTTQTNAGGNGNANIHEIAIVGYYD